MAMEEFWKAYGLSRAGDERKEERGDRCRVSWAADVRIDIVGDEL